MAAAATTDGTPGHLALLRDSSEGRSYSVNTGSVYSILPFSSTAQTMGPALPTASGASKKAWGCRRLHVAPDFSGQLGHIQRLEQDAVLLTRGQQGQHGLHQLWLGGEELQ